MAWEMVDGYFTTEDNIRGLTPKEMEERLGFWPGRLAQGARVLVLDREPRSNEFEPVGSTYYPLGKGLDRSALHKTKFRPGAWLGRRLVKVKRVGVEIECEFPRASIAAEQWTLTTRVWAHEV